jgi:tRNA(Ile2) C34 agmatinyltransferase TiaS
MKPIHKLNNGQGATLCNQCSVIISLGHTEDLYCKECKEQLKK